MKLKFLIILLLLFACTKTQLNQKMTLNDFYDYEKLSSFEYRETIDTHVSNIKQKVSIDKSKKYIILDTTISSDNKTSSSKIWLNLFTKECFQIAIDLSDPISCPFAEDKELMKYETEESIEVLSGKFLAKKYSNSQIEIWVSKDIPIPIKSKEINSGATSELVAYS